MSMSPQEIRDLARVAARDVQLKSLLLDVKHEGSVTIPKRKLLWLIGDRKNENWTVWAALLDAWESLGEKRESLYGTYDGPRIILIAGKPDQLATTWANSGKDPVEPALAA